MMKIAAAGEDASRQFLIRMTEYKQRKTVALLSGVMGKDGSFGHCNICAFWKNCRYFTFGGYRMKSDRGPQRERQEGSTPRPRGRRRSALLAVKRQPNFADHPVHRTADVPARRGCGASARHGAECARGSVCL